MIDSLLKYAKKYKNIVVLNAGCNGERECENFEKFFPERCFGFGLSESNLVSAAAGFALTGKLPFVVGDADVIFSKAFSQILNDICLPNLNVKFIDIQKYPIRVVDKIVDALPNMKILFASNESKKENMINELLSTYGPMCLTSAS